MGKIGESTFVLFVIFHILKLASPALATTDLTRTTSTSGINDNDSNTSIATQAADINNSTVTTKTHELQSTSLSFTTSGVDHLPSLAQENCDGFPCSEDQFCSKTQKRCRQCNVFDDVCNDTVWIHQHAAVCEAYCQKMLVERLQTECFSEKGVLNSTITELERNCSVKEAQWVRSSTQKDEALEQCARSNHNLTSQLQVKKVELTKLQINVLERQNEVRACRVSAEELDLELTKLQTNVSDLKDEVRVCNTSIEKLERERIILHIVIGLLCGLLVLACTTFCHCYHRRDARTLPHYGRMFPGNESRPIYLGGRPEAAGKKLKQPTEVDKRSTSFDPSKDKMVPSGGRDGHTPLIPSEREQLSV